MILAPATLESKPDTVRAKLRVHVRDLQRECSLTDEAVGYMAAVAGPGRYEEDKGELVIECGETMDRAENQRLCLK
jgi:hypothetical protein